MKDLDNAVVSSQVNPVWTDESNIAASEFEVLFVVQLGPLSLTPYQLLEGGEGVVKAMVQFINQHPAARYVCVPCAERRCEVHGNGRNMSSCVC